MLFHIWSELESCDGSVLRPGGFQLALDEAKFVRAQGAKLPPLILCDDFAQRFRQARSFEAGRSEMR